MVRQNLQRQKCHCPGRNNEGLIQFSGLEVHPVRSCKQALRSLAHHPEKQTLVLHQGLTALFLNWPDPAPQSGRHDEWC